MKGTAERLEKQNYYGTRLVEDYRLGNLRDAVLKRVRDYDYEFPQGDGKICGLAPIDDLSFGWTVGVEIDESDVFRPTQMLIYWLFGGADSTRDAGRGVYLPYCKRNHRAAEDSDPVGTDHRPGQLQGTRAYPLFGRSRESWPPPSTKWPVRFLSAKHNFRS